MTDITKPLTREESAGLSENVRLSLLKSSKGGTWYDGWRPYCMKCSAMNRMVQQDYGFQCSCCSNMIGWNLMRLVESPLNDVEQERSIEVVKYYTQILIDSYRQIFLTLWGTPDHPSDEMLAAMSNAVKAVTDLSSKDTEVKVFTSSLRPYQIKVMETIKQEVDDHKYNRLSFEFQRILVKYIRPIREGQFESVKADLCDAIKSAVKSQSLSISDVFLDSYRANAHMITRRNEPIETCYISHESGKKRQPWSKRERNKFGGMKNSNKVIKR